MYEPKIPYEKWPLVIPIGFHGPSGSGKSTHATLLKLVLEAHQIPCVTIPMALSVKKTAQAIFDLPDNPLAETGLSAMRNTRLETPIPTGDKGTLSTMRHAYQWTGTDMGRKLLGKQFWINKIHQRITRTAKALYETSDPTVIPLVILIDDVRFDNEAEYIIENRGFLLGISETTPTTKAAPADNHECESGLSKEFLELANRGPRNYVITREGNDLGGIRIAIDGLRGVCAHILDSIRVKPTTSGDQESYAAIASIPTHYNPNQPPRAGHRKLGKQEYSYPEKQLPDAEKEEQGGRLKMMEHSEGHLILHPARKHLQCTACGWRCYLPAATKHPECPECKKEPPQDGDTL